ncbi:MAG: ABC transporter ATP-binding protein [Sedimentisphaerales bacterium]|nr:ABC transporter ATP-binding protein [Sedimentisphaerales bacterium]
MTYKNDYILSCRDIYKSYPMGATKLEVLKGANLSITRGEFVAIRGASGSGKSTLLHILGALDMPDRGDVFFEGKDIDSFSARQANEFRNKKIGFVFQFYHLLDELTVLENVLLARMAHSSAVDWLACSAPAKSRAHQLLGELGLSERIAHRPFQLSGGERQRVAIARALMNQPDVILADEPTGNLDSQTGSGILEIFEKLHSVNQTVVMVTHDEKIAARAQRVIRLADGRILTT